MIKELTDIVVQNWKVIPLVTAMGVMVYGLFDHTIEGERTYHPLPQERYPDKTEIPLYE